MTTKAKTETAIVPAAHAKSVLVNMAARYNCESGKLLDTLKNTVFKNATNEQLMALCIVADQYRLNPFTKEVYAFPDKAGGIVPVVSIDGWLRIINDHPQYDGMEVQNDGESCTCTIYRKDRTHPTVATEYMSECARKTAPWESHPQRMLRHKAIIQCARMAFGFALKDPDEADRIIEAEKDWAPIPMPKAITVASVETAHEQTPAQPAPADIAQPTREDLVVAIGQMLDAAKASKVDKAMKAVGIAWQDGESWEQASDETLAKLAAALK